MSSNTRTPLEKTILSSDSQIFKHYENMNMRDSSRSRSSTKRDNLSSRVYNVHMPLYLRNNDK